MNIFTTLMTVISCQFSKQSSTTFPARKSWILVKLLFVHCYCIAEIAVNNILFSYLNTEYSSRFCRKLSANLNCILLQSMFSYRRNLFDLIDSTVVFLFWYKKFVCLFSWIHRKTKYRRWCKHWIIQLPEISPSSREA